MLDLSQLTDIELRVLLRGNMILRDNKLGISEKVVSKRLYDEMMEEANKRCLEVVPRWQ